MRLKLLILLAVLLIPFVIAEKGHMTLLAVKESGTGMDVGSAADLYLEIVPGSGRIFIETYPFSKLDTQISTRFAKDVACKFVDKDCSKYDFFYTINADSPIIAGPSAGASTTVLTVALLDGLEIDESIAITGTINSGGLIGPVSGIKAKIDAAALAGIKTVLIPKGTGTAIEDNMSINMTAVGEELGVEVIEVGELNEVVYEFTNITYEDSIGELMIDEEYMSTMRMLEKDLCNRTANLQEQMMAETLNISDYDKFMDVESIALNLTERSGISRKKGDYYTSASYCYGANVRYRYLLFLAKDLDENQISDYVESGKESVEEINIWLEGKELRTLTDLQAYIVVKERVDDALNNFEDAYENMRSNDTENSLFRLASGVERLYSASSWSTFFDQPGEEFVFDKESLKESCVKKIAEAEERYQYAALYFPSLLTNTQEEIADARMNKAAEEYAVCLSKASMAKAEADLIMTLVGVSVDNIDEVAKQKLEIVKKTIIRQFKTGVFPILGYSYYEYANSLLANDVSSAMLYAEYSLEISNLDMYFEKGTVEEDDEISINMDVEKIVIFAAGVVLGFVVFGLVGRKKGSKKK